MIDALAWGAVRIFTALWEHVVGCLRHLMYAGLEAFQAVVIAWFLWIVGAIVWYGGQQVLEWAGKGLLWMRRIGEPQR